MGSLTDLVAPPNRRYMNARCYGSVVFNMYEQISFIPYSNALHRSHMLLEWV
jgi:hypothetical protein